MMLLGVIGWPIAHSRSPAMHTAAIQALGLDARYLPMAVCPEDLPAAMAGLRALGFRGVNATLPHKRALLELVDHVDETARVIGAVNTVVFEADGARGTNTDAAGMVAALDEAGVELAGSRVVVLGAGGAARAAVGGAIRAGARSVHIAARVGTRAQALATALGDAAGDTALSAGELNGALGAHFRDTDLVIQASSATLGDTEAAHAFADALPLDALPANASVFDMVYQPRVTSVLRAASSRGLRCVGGLGMLLHQGALAFEAFTGRTPNLDAMRAALEST